MQYLGVIEQRTNELLEIYNFSKDLKSKESNKKHFSVLDKDKNVKPKHVQTIKSLLNELNTVTEDNKDKNNKTEEKVKALSIKQLKQKGSKKAKELLNQKIQ